MRVENVMLVLRRAQRWSGTTQGILLILLSTFASAAMSTTSKILVIDYSTTQILFFRCAFASFFAASWAIYHGWSISLASPHWRTHILRGMLNIFSLVLYVWPMAYLPLADVVALSFTQPLFATALSIPILRERVTLKTWIAVVAGFCGMLIVLRPGFGSEQLFMRLAVVFGSLLWALSVILTRRLTGTESSTKIVIYLLVTGTTMTGLALPFEWLTPTALDLVLLCGLGIASACTQFLVTEAYRRAAASTISPYFYSTLLWTSAIGYAIWGDVPDVYVVTGSAILLCCGVYLAAHSRSRNAEPIASTNSAT
jgi:drug/metabolite transporter (DMT)-like permease